MHVQVFIFQYCSFEIVSIGIRMSIVFCEVMHCIVNLIVLLNQTRKVFKSRIQKAISKRRESGSEVNDLLNAFMSIKEFEVPDYDICCMMTGMLFAASATTAAFIPWVLKYLHDFPEVRQRVQVK